MSADHSPNSARNCVVLVPVGTHIEPACESGLQELERRGHPVWRVRGYSAIDQCRNQLASDALAQGFQETMWIDSDIAFNPDDIERLRSQQLPIVCGIYPKKGKRELAVHVLPGTSRILLGEGGGLTEILYAATGFLHVRRHVYETILTQLKLRVCNLRFGSGLIPWFQPMSVALNASRSSDPDSDERESIEKFSDFWYLAEDFSFCERARQCGFTILADTRIRLSHIGSYPYSWEEAGTDPKRYATFALNVGGDSGEGISPKIIPDSLGAAPVRVDVPAPPPSVSSAESNVRYKAANNIVPKMAWNDIPGWFDYATIFDSVVNSCRPDSILVEIGTWLGRSTAYLGMIAKRADKGLKICAIDHCMGSDEPLHLMTVNAAGGNIASALLSNLRHCGLTDIVMPLMTSSLQASALFAESTLPFVYIDGSHSYEDVQRDITAWWPKIEPGGIMAGHDYQANWPGVVQAVDEHFGSKFGVPGKHLAQFHAKIPGALLRNDRSNLGAFRLRVKTVRNLDRLHKDVTTTYYTSSTKL